MEDVLDTDIVHRPYLFHVIPIEPRSKESTEGQSASLVLQEEFEKDAQKPLNNYITEKIKQPEEICKNHIQNSFNYMLSTSLKTSLVVITSTDLVDG